ncbi:MAG: alpha/beta fold hydrolase [Calditrichia bacterium]
MLKTTLFLSLFAQGTLLAQPAAPDNGTVLLNPIEFMREGVNLVGEEGFIFVPENRTVENSRVISVHFYRFPAVEKSGLAPVFILPGGPGGSYTYRNFYKYYSGIRAELWVKELKALNRKRDVVIVNQRGNSRPPGLNSGDWRWAVEKAAPDTLETATEGLNRYAKGVKQGIEHWTKKGVDLAGYDIINISEDLEDLRQALDYKKIALRGNSFGSQWSLAYMKRWPQHVDRAMLAGVEPLDFAWDSAAWLWKALERLDKRAIAGLSKDISGGSYLDAFKQVVTRLEKSNAEVTLGSGDEAIRVMLGADDVRSSITGRLGNSRRESLEYLPQFILELFREDYRFLAHKTADDKGSIFGGSMITALIDNSLGISDRREKVLNSESAIKWLGDPNGYYKVTRGLTPTPEVNDDFRFEKPIDIPVLMMQGDLDFSTPYENALHLQQFLTNGHLVTIVDGTHSAVGEAIQLKEDEAMKLFAFMDADFTTVSPKDVFKSLPDKIELPPLEFKTLEESSLYEKFVEED